jgi:two-component system sensor histidine kinase KdpD
VYFALQARERISGVMVLVLSGRVTRLSDAQERWVQTASVQLALALDRVHNIDLASKARLAEKNERFRNSILSSISHDIRTPLTTVVGLAEQLAMEGEGGETAARLHRAALRMDATVTNLLDIARFSQHGIVIQEDWASIDEIIGSAIQMQRGDAARLEFDSEIRGTPALVRFDALLIEKVLCNLIGNAVLHGHGATYVAVRARFRQRWLQVSVMDDGCGIAHPLSIANVLAPDGDRPRDHGGLGLSICQAICDAHGGRLRIFGRPGKGCCAIFSIPVAETIALDYGDVHAG